MRSVTFRCLSLVVAFSAIQCTMPAGGTAWAASRSYELTAGFVQSTSDDTLAAVRRNDQANRRADGKLDPLTAAEHLRRARIYLSNRAFDEAREHWNALIDYYPNDSRVPEALLGIGRSYFQSRQYEEAYAAFDNLARTFPTTKDGREGLNFSGSALLRLNRPAEAVDKYIEYIHRYPNGERIDTAHLNVIDGLREAGRPEEAIDWVRRTRETFKGTPTETNALFALLRLQVAEGYWTRAAATADEINAQGYRRGVTTTPAEVAYLKALSLERAGKLDAAFAAYLAIPDGVGAYYGWLASERLRSLDKNSGRPSVRQRLQRIDSEIAAAQEDYPTPYRQAVLKAAKARALDPRFIMAVIRQESVFKPLAKSNSGARGLLQLTIDLAQKYAPGAGLNSLNENELYRPDTSILVGSEYLAELQKLFPNMLEAVAASYNGGEDNVARWVKRAKIGDRGAFTAEIGFDETKAYVQKVMTNYRAYLQLYTADLERR